MSFSSSTKPRHLTFRRIVAVILTVAVGFQLNLAALAVGHVRLVGVARAVEPPDTTSPTVSLTAPANGDTLSGTVTVTAAASDNVGVTSVQLKLNGVHLGDVLTAAPYTYSWGTATVSNNTYTLTATAMDGAGNAATSDPVAVTVNNQPPDVTPPTVALTAPAANDTVIGTVNVTAAATDDVGVTSVQLKLDGTPLGDPLTTAPYTAGWNTTAVSNGAHSLSAEATDAAGNRGSSAALAITVNNPDTTPPTVIITSPLPGDTVNGVVTLLVQATDNIAVTNVQFKIDNLLVGDPLTVEPYTYTWNTVAVINGSHAITALARDAAGNEAAAQPITLTVNNPDVTPPQVRIVEPVGGASVTGAVPLSADATDDTGVMAVRFRVNGGDLGSSISSPPYTTTWSTDELANGCYALTAVATDRANQSTTSDEVLVIVNHAPPPSCSEGGDCASPSNVANTNVGEFQNCGSASANSGINSANGHDSPTPVDISTGTATAGVDLPSVVNTNLTEINSAGAGSGDTTIDLSVSNYNEATLSNSVEANATTGDNQTNDNRYSNTSTGDAGVFTSILNVVNTNIVGSAFNSIVNTIAENFVGTIDFLQMMLDLLDGLIAKYGDARYNLTVNNQSQGTIDNNVEINASTGGNLANNNRYGNIATGDVNVAANIFNLLNTNIVGSNWLFSALNILGDFTGDIILPGEGVLENPFGDRIGSLTVNNNNRAEVLNRVQVNGDSGSNDATNNRDGALVNTGNVFLQTSILNTVNTNIVGANMFSFLPHIFGSWQGEIVNGPTTNPWQNYHTGDEQGNIAVTNDNDAIIRNNLKINATTGKNTATGNRRATINTGNINVAANLFNLANTNVVGSNWLFGHFNVYGAWRGNIIYAYPDLAVTNHHQEATPHPGDLVTYTLRYANLGRAPAQNVRLEDTLPENTSFVNATAGGVLNNSQVVWILDRVPANTPERIVSFTVRVNPDLPVGDTLLKNSVTISTTTNELQRGNNTAGSELVVSVAPPPPPAPAPPPPPPDPLSPPVPPAPEVPSSAGAANGPGKPEMTIRKTNSASAALPPGENVSFAIDVTNSGDVDLENILVHDVLPGRTAVLFAKDFPLNRLGVGETMKISYTLTIASDTPPGRYTNTATATAGYAGSTVGPVSARSSVEVRPAANNTPSATPAPSEKIVPGKTKVGDPVVLIVSQKNSVRGKVKQGGKVNFIVTIINKSKQALKNVALVGKLINGSVNRMSWKLGNLAAGKGLRFSFSLSLLSTARAGKYLSETVATAKMSSGTTVTSNTSKTNFTVVAVTEKSTAKKNAVAQGSGIARTDVGGFLFYDQRSRAISAWQYAKLNNLKLIDVLRSSKDQTDRQFVATYDAGLTLVGKRGKYRTIITLNDVLNDLRTSPRFKHIFGSGG